MRRDGLCRCGVGSAHTLHSSSPTFLVLLSPQNLPPRSSQSDTIVIIVYLHSSPSTLFQFLPQSSLLLTNCPQLAVFILTTSLFSVRFLVPDHPVRPESRIHPRCRSILLFVASGQLLISPIQSARTRHYVFVAFIKLFTLLFHSVIIVPTE